MEWQRTFEVSVSVERAWQAFMDRSEPAPWNNVFIGDAYLARSGVGVEVTAEQGSGAERHLAWLERVGAEVTEMQVTFTATESGARITLTRSGFGAGDEWLNRNAGRFHGWVEAMLDFVLFAERGMRGARHTPSGTHYRRLGRFGFGFVEDHGGVRVSDVGDGPGRAAGVQRDDVILAVNDAPVFFLSDMWMLQRLLKPGDPVDFTYVRGEDVRSGHACMPEAN